MAGVSCYRILVLPRAYTEHFALLPCNFTVIDCVINDSHLAGRAAILLLLLRCCHGSHVHSQLP